MRIYDQALSKYIASRLLCVSTIESSVTIKTEYPVSIEARKCHGVVQDREFCVYIGSRDL